MNQASGCNEMTSGHTENVCALSHARMFEKCRLCAGTTVRGRLQGICKEFLCNRMSFIYMHIYIVFHMYAQVFHIYGQVFQCVARVFQCVAQVFQCVSQVFQCVAQVFQCVS